ncbi:MAG TPA: YbhN family protein [Acidimicrobiales bacterium]|nr:YbhN family protein [Acidimicrobiales bacterium]
MTPPDPPIVAAGPGPWRRAWPVFRVVVALAAVGLGGWVVSGKTDELRSVSGYLDHLRWWWMLVAVAAELLSYTALSSLQRRLLRCGRVRVPARSMLGITLAGSAIQYSFPGGGVVYLAYLFRQFRRWGADDLLATWVVVAFNIVTFSALALLSAAGLALALGLGSTYDLVEVILGIVAVSALLSLLILERRRLLPHATRLVALSQRLFRRPARDRAAAEVVDDWTRELGVVSPSRPVWARAFAMGLANWVADMSCLTLSFFAVGVGVPWRGLLLAYGAGQLAAILPITPGGLGAVEGSLTVALVTFGGGADSTVAAVLLYRLVSFWLLLPVGWGSWGALALAGRRSREPGRQTTSALESGG